MLLHYMKGCDNSNKALKPTYASISNSVNANRHIVKHSTDSINDASTACNRCRYLGHTANDTEACDAFCDEPNVITIRSPKNVLCKYIWSCI